MRVTARAARPSGPMTSASKGGSRHRGGASPPAPTRPRPAVSPPFDFSGISITPPVLQRQPRPQSRDVVEVRRAREELARLEPLLMELRILEMRTLQERIDILRRRQELDATMVEPIPGQRAPAEERLIARLNRRPLRIEVGARSVRFIVRFHVQFEDGAMGDRRFGDLERNLRAGIAQVWNHRLRGEAFGGRRFELVPHVTRVGTQAPRDHDAWLIRVSARYDGQVTYPGCNIDPTDPHVPTSVTDASCDGGVMLVPPSHIDRPNVLGHETLHLFGLVDRYVSQTVIRRGERPAVVNQPLRDTGGRPDPLATEAGTILREDLGFLFIRLGVYDEELSRLRANIGALERRAMRLREIVRLGRRPSLIDSVIPRDFNDRSLDSVRDL